MAHILTEKNLETKTAVCAVDGPVAIRSKGLGRFQCAVKKSEKRRAWADRNPDVARASRATRSAHRLTTFDASTMTGECPVCGTVGAVVKGRRRKDGTPGAMCANRANELWPTAGPETPQEFCGVCRRAYLTADGVCLRCSDDDQVNLNLGLAVIATQRREALEIEDLVEDGLTVITPLDTPAEMPRIESAVHGWKTLGSGDPHRWWAENAHLIESEV